jgi:hypothetical protein
MRRDHRLAMARLVFESALCGPAVAMVAAAPVPGQACATRSMARMPDIATRATSSTSAAASPDNPKSIAFLRDRHRVRWA